MVDFGGGRERGEERAGGWRAVKRLVKCECGMY